MKQDKKENQKPISVKQLVEATKNANLKKSEAIVSAIKLDNETAHLKWEGTNKDILDLVFTLLHNDMHIAAIVCKATKDFIETLKTDRNAWMRLTQEIQNFDGYNPQSTIIMDGKEAAS